MAHSEAALLWMLAGVLGVCAEFCLPGWVLPGVAGAVGITYGGYQLHSAGANPWAMSALAAAFALSATAGFLHFSWWTGAVCAAAAFAAAARLPVAAAAWAAPAPTLAIFWLTRVASRAVANKTII